jgi:addiction module RelE/StbE family toxin
MRVAFTKPFKKDYKKLPSNIQVQIDKQIERLLENQNHPSLRIKKMEGHEYVWEARVTVDYRMTFQISDDIYILRRVGTHPILRRP